MIRWVIKSEKGYASWLDELSYGPFEDARFYKTKREASEDLLDQPDYPKERVVKIEIKEIK